MIPTPDDVVPLLEPCVPLLHDALCTGIEFAHEAQADELDRDPYFWAHCARYKARRHLNAMDRDGWSLAPNVPNSGIHLRIEGIHIARVLRSLGGSAPHPGPNRARQLAWRFDNRMWLGNPPLPPLNLIIDWTHSADEPILHVGLPVAPWPYGQKPLLHWRVLLHGGDSLGGWRFEPEGDPGDAPVRLRLDPAEFEDEAG